MKSEFQIQCNAWVDCLSGELETNQKFPILRGKLGTVTQPGLTWKRSLLIKPLLPVRRSTACTFLPLGLDTVVLIP